MKRAVCLVRTGRRERSAGVRSRLCCKGITPALWRQTAGDKKISLMCVMEYFWYPIFLLNCILIKLLLKYPLSYQPALFHSRKGSQLYIYIFWIIHQSELNTCRKTRCYKNPRESQSWRLCWLIQFHLYCVVGERSLPKSCAMSEFVWRRMAYTITLQTVFDEVWHSFLVEE